MSTSLVKFQIGPVQEFISQARSTRDLWSGSYLLSWLIAAGIRKLLDNGGELVFPNPNPKEQPLLGNPESWRDLKDHTALLTPNLPNLFVAKIPSVGAKNFAVEIQQAIEGEWRKIYEAVWKHQDFIAADQRDRFERQVKRFLSVSWQVTPLNENDYATAYQQNGRQLDATRQTRDFKA
jgi:CRISPR-associated protein Cmr2